MSEHAAVTTESIDILSLNLPNDLRREALEALRRGDDFEIYERSLNGVRVVTLVVDGRAGQASNGDASWGDWDDARQVIELDSGEAVDLNGDLVAA